MAVLNDTTVRRARPRRTKYELTCDAVRGFVLRVLPSGKKVYLVRHRPEGRDVRVQIGPAETMSCDAARAKALEILRGQPSEAAQTSPPATLSAPSPVPESMIIERAPRPQRSRVPKLAEFAARYDREHIARHTKPRTQERYRQQLRMYLIPTLGDLALDQIGPVDVERLHASMSGVPSAANNTVRLLNHIFTKARDWSVLPHTHPHPTRTVRMYRQRMRDRFLSPEERARLERVLRKGETLRHGQEGSIRWATAAGVRLLALTGMRRSEVLGLQWSMVDARHRCLRLPDSKTGQKVVPISSHVLALLDRLRDYQRPDIPWVLYSCNDSPIDPVSFNASWRIIRRRAGLVDVRLHDLRHSAASDALMAGVPLEVVSKILGHASVRTTARYAHLSDEVVKRAVELMGESIVTAERSRLGQGRGRRRGRRGVSSA